MQEVKVRPISRQLTDEISALHIRGIDRGFISSLGPKFVQYLYEAIIESDKAFGFVALQDEKIVGFVSCAEDVKAIYRDVIRKHFFRLVLAILPKFINPANIKRALETLLYPKRAETLPNLPKAELLSIVVDESARGAGIGKLLFNAAEEEFKKQGISEFKIMVGEDLAANKFYQKIGCELIGQIPHHGYKLNVYIKKIW